MVVLAKEPLATTRTSTGRASITTRTSSSCCTAECVSENVLSLRKQCALSSGEKPFSQRTLSNSMVVSSAHGASNGLSINALMASRWKLETTRAATLEFLSLP